MSVNVLSNTELSRYELFDNDELAGIEFYELSDGQIPFIHTEVFLEHKGATVSRRS